MRMTVLHPDVARGGGLVATDLEVDVGTTLRRARPHLARLTGWAGWTSVSASPAVGDRVLTDDHRAGLAPWVPGSVLRPAPQAQLDPVEEAAARPHVAVVAGPRAGRVVPLAPRGRTRVDGVPVRTSTRGRVRARRRRWRRDHLLVAGPSLLALRDPTRPGRVRRSVAPGLGLWAGPLAGAVALGWAMHEPWLLLAGLAGPAAGVLGARRGTARHRPVEPGDEPASPTDLAGIGVASAHAARADTAEQRLHAPWDASGSLAVVGPRAEALGVARALLLGELGTHGTPHLAVRPARPRDWAWAAWLTTPDAALPRSGPALVVLDVARPGDPRTRAESAEVAAWWTSPSPDTHVLVVAPDRAAVPAWCASVVETARPLSRAATGTKRGAATRHDRATRPPSRTEAAWADAQARRVAAARHRARPSGALPTSVHLGALEGVPAPARTAVRAAWARGDTGVALGIREGGEPLVVDLRRDGPHVLVAGTTGSGKSELLTTLVLGHALAAPPDRLAVLLVDFKGGTGLGAVAALPHVIDHVTDLDAARARRVLVGLAAELRRRERVLAERGASDLGDLEPGDAATPERLLVVVDELRALADDVPEAMPTLARIAAQGRSLGVHLVLATQRPAGAVPPDLRANLTLRICLRVTDTGDSLDVLDSPDAAALDHTRPGAALVRLGAQPLVRAQLAIAATGDGAPVRPAPPWSSATWAPTRPTPALRGAETWVAAVRAAAAGRPAPRTPWLPALPTVVRVSDVPPGPGLPIAVADHPAEQRRGAVRWDPATGHLLVLGGPGSGRTTTLLAVAAQAAGAGIAVHGVGLPASARDALRSLVPSAGSVLEAAEAVAVATLLELLAVEAHPALLLVDGLDAVLDALTPLARGAGPDRLTSLWRAPTGGVTLAVAAAPGAAALRHAAAFRTRLVLPVQDDAADALAGVPRALAGPRRVPGRAVHLQDGVAALCQVALPEPPDEVALGVPMGPGTPSEPVVVPLPRVARRPPRRDSTWRAVPLGVGGRSARPVTVDLAAPFVVVGPPGSGRTHALEVLRDGAERAGVRVVRATGPAGTRPALGADDLLLVDDLDDLERTGSTDGWLADELQRRDARLVVAASAQAAVAGFRGPLAVLLRRRRVLVLATGDPTSADVVGPRAPWLADPRGEPPGRGALVEGRSVVPVQVYA